MQILCTLFEAVQHLGVAWAGAVQPHERNVVTGRATDGQVLEHLAHYAAKLEALSRARRAEDDLGAWSARGFEAAMTALAPGSRPGQVLRYERTTCPNSTHLGMAGVQVDQEVLVGGDGVQANSGMLQGARRAREVLLQRSSQRRLVPDGDVARHPVWIDRLLQVVDLPKLETRGVLGKACMAGIMPQAGGAPGCEDKHPGTTDKHA